MVEMLTEKPTTIGLIGGLATAVLFVVWLQAPRRGLLLGMLGALALTATLLLVERLVITDREALEQTLYEIADTVRQKDLEKLLPYIHSSAHAVRAEATREYNLYRLDDARITQVWAVNVQSEAQPKQAEIEFNVMVTGGPQTAGLGTRRIVVYMLVRFEQENGQWKVTHYEWHEASHALRRNPTKRP
jgi:hypothetical protein